MPKNTLPEWEQALSSAAHLQRILPEAVLVGDTASALYADHRMSVDADHVLTDLRERFDLILAELESVAGWKTARVKRPVMILGNLDGIETGIRQLIREQPLETHTMEYRGATLTVPTEAEILRIKAALILKRNATRDYLDLIALANHLGTQQTLAALEPMDRLYPQPNDASALQQLQTQLANPLPYDLDQVNLTEYKNLHPDWHDWRTVKNHCAELAVALLDHCAE